MYVFIKTEPKLWTVGHYDAKGNWFAESDHESPEEASKRVSFLNGNSQSEAIDWKKTRIHYIHETNSGVGLVKANIRIAKRYLDLYKKEQINLNTLVEEMEESFKRALNGVQKIKDSQDYIYTKIENLK